MIICTNHINIVYNYFRQGSERNISVITTERNDVVEKCRSVTEKMLSVGPAEYVEIANRIIQKYRQRFGPQSYQIIPLQDCLLSLIAVAESPRDNKVVLFGYDTDFVGNGVILGTFVSSVAEQNSLELQRAFTKMLTAIYKL